MKSFKKFLVEQQETKTSSDDYHQRFHSNLQTQFPNEYQTIMQAAQRNKIEPTDYENLSMLFAVRKAEGGRKGREFGVLTPAAMEQPGDTEEKTLDRQAGWAASSILKNRERYEQSDKSTDFVTFMGNRWAPRGVANDPTDLNKHWPVNVSKFRQSYLDCVGPNCPKPPQTTTTKPTSTETQKPTTVAAQTVSTDTKVEDNDYEIKPGDSLSKIAQQNNTTVEELAKMNNISDVNKIRAGARIKIPKR